MNRRDDPPLDPAVARWLTTPEALALLDEHAAAEASPVVVRRLRRALSAERAAAVLEQVELRRRASAKFGRAAEMLFTRKGLEQATDEWVARYKAERFAAAGGPVADVCTGVGGDLIGLRLAGVGGAGVERDAAVARFAGWNAALHGDGEVEIVCGDADEVDVAAFAAWHADPDRRPAGRRTTRPDAHEPSLERLSAWRERNAAAAVKLAPAARLPEAWGAECELEWVSRRGECRQLVAWCGPLAARPGERRATRVAAEGAPASVVGDPHEPTDVARAIGAFVFEPDPAVIAAGLVGVVARRAGLSAFAPGIAYLTGDRDADDPLLAAFAVEELMPMNRKRVAAWLAERGVGRLEIKARGVAVDPERLRRELRPRGDDAATLLVAPDPAGGRDKPVVIVARRIG